MEQQQQLPFIQPQPPSSPKANNGGTERPRKRSAKACDHCHRRKVRCDAGAPCSSCMKAGIECVYSPGLRRRFRRSQPVDSDTHTKLADLLFGKTNDDSQYDGPNSEPASPKSLKLRKRRMSLSNAFEREEVQSQTSSQDSVSDRFWPYRSMKHSNSSLGSVSMSSINNYIVSPTSTTAVEDYPELVDYFFAHMYPTAPVFHERSFRLNIKRQSPLLMYAMYAFVSCYSSARKDGIVNCPRSVEFHEKAKRLLSDSLDEESVSVVQALIMLTSYGSLTGNASLGCSYSALAVGKALGLGLNLDPDDDYETKNLSAVEKEVRRRCWWTCYSMDRIVSYTTLRPTSIDESCCKTSLPMPEHVFNALDDTSTIVSPLSGVNLQTYKVKSLALKANLDYFNFGVLQTSFLGKVTAYAKRAQEKHFTYDFLLENESAYLKEHHAILAQLRPPEWTSNYSTELKGVDFKRVEAVISLLSSALLLNCPHLITVDHNRLAELDQVAVRNSLAMASEISFIAKVISSINPSFSYMSPQIVASLFYSSIVLISVVSVETDPSILQQYADFLLTNVYCIRQISKVWVSCKRFDAVLSALISKNPGSHSKLKAYGKKKTESFTSTISDYVSSNEISPASADQSLTFSADIPYDVSYDNDMNFSLGDLINEGNNVDMKQFWDLNPIAAGIMNATASEDPLFDLPTALGRLSPTGRKSPASRNSSGRNSPAIPSVATIKEERRYSRNVLVTDRQQYPPGHPTRIYPAFSRP